jgi:hypothetical protein
MPDKGLTRPRKLLSRRTLRTVSVPWSVYSRDAGELGSVPLAGSATMPPVPENPAMLPRPAAHALLLPPATRATRQ